MQRTPVNPTTWSQPLGFHQGEVLQGVRRRLVVAGQTATDAQGAPQHPGDMRAQMARALDNLEGVLNAAGMGLAQLTCLRIHATDVDAALGAFDILGARLGRAGAMPPQTLLGVTRLALPELMIEIEAEAAD